MLTALGAACGGEDDEPPLTMSIDVSHAGLSADLATARVDLHTGDRRCEELRASGPIVGGTYHVDVDLSGSMATQATGDISKIRPGMYTVVVWGFSAKTAVAATAYGCAEQVSIQSGKRTHVSLKLVPYPR